MKKKIKNLSGDIVLNIFFIVVCFIALIPILYAFSVSLNAQNNLLSSDFTFIPKEFTLRNYKAVLFEEPVLLWLKNSAILSLSTLAISLGVAIPAAYAFSRYRFPGKKVILYVLLLLNAFPTILSMFAIYRLLSPVGLADKKIGLIIVYTGTMAIFGLWNLKGYFDTIPRGIEEAAKIDGANDFQLAVKIMLPLSKPAIISNSKPTCQKNISRHFIVGYLTGDFNSSTFKNSLFS